MERVKKITSVVGFVFLLILSGAFINIAGAVQPPLAEESSDTVYSTDRVTEGKVDKRSRKKITVDGKEHSLCRDVVIYNIRGELGLKHNDIERESKVKLFSSSLKGCVRKIKIVEIPE